MNKTEINEKCFKCDVKVTEITGFRPYHTYNGEYKFLCFKCNKKYIITNGYTILERYRL